MPADGRRLPGFDERRCAEIDIADMGENAHGRDQGRAQEPYDHDLQMRTPIGTV